MSFTQVFLGPMNQVQHPLLPVSKVKTEVLMEIKNEPPESDIVEIGADNIISSLEEETIPDLKDIDIELHPLCEDLIKSEPVPEDILEIKHLESVDTQVYVKTENSPFIKRENKTEDTSNRNGRWGTGQGMVEVQGNLETDKQLDFNFSNDLKVTSSRKANHPEKIGFARCYKSNESTSREKEKEKIEIIRAPIIPAQPHEYTSLAKDKHVCNHCQHTSNKLENLKLHIRKMHREVTTMYHCPYCPYKSKWSIRKHIIQKHKSAKDIQWFQYCSEKCAKKRQLNYHCDKCNYKSYNLYNLKNHKLTHLKPEEIQYFYCYHCSHKSKLKVNLKRHIFRHFKNENVPYHCYVCDFVTQKRDLIIKHIRKHFKNRYKYDETINKYQLESHIENLERRYPCNRCDYITYEKAYLKRHELTHLKPEEIQYFYCYHCSFKSKRKGILKDHIFRHFKNENVTFHCYICDFMTLKRDSIVAHFKKHPEHHSKYKYQLETNTKKLEKRYHYCDKCDYKTYNTGHLKEHKMIHLKPEEIEYFYCYHCSVKTKYKQYLKNHILKHFRNEIVPFHCYICKFMTLKRDEIIEHLKKHPEHHIKLDKTKYK